MKPNFIARVDGLCDGMGGHGLLHHGFLGSGQPEEKDRHCHHAHQMVVVDANLLCLAQHIRANNGLVGFSYGEDSEFCLSFAGEGFGHSVTSVAPRSIRYVSNIQHLHYWRWHGPVDVWVEFRVVERIRHLLDVGAVIIANVRNSFCCPGFDFLTNHVGFLSVSSYAHR